MNFQMQMRVAVSILEKNGFSVARSNENEVIVNGFVWSEAEVRREAAAILFAEASATTVEEAPAEEEGPDVGTLDQLLAILAFAAEQRLAELDAIWLERLLDQERSAEVRQFLDQAPTDQSKLEASATVAEATTQEEESMSENNSSSFNNLHAAGLSYLACRALEREGLDEIATADLFRDGFDFTEVPGIGPVYFRQLVNALVKSGLIARSEIDVEAVLEQERDAEAREAMEEPARQRVPVQDGFLHCILMRGTMIFSYPSSTKDGKKKMMRREVLPYALFESQAGHLCVKAWDGLRRDFRTFRLDRMTDVSWGKSVAEKNDDAAVTVYPVSWRSIFTAKPHRAETTYAEKLVAGGHFDTKPRAEVFRAA